MSWLFIYSAGLDEARECRHAGATLVALPLGYEWNPFVVASLLTCLNNVCFPGLPGDNWHWRQWRCIPIHTLTHAHHPTLSIRLTSSLLFTSLQSAFLYLQPKPFSRRCYSDHWLVSLLYLHRSTPQPPTEWLLRFNNKRRCCCIWGWNERFQTSAAIHQIKLDRKIFLGALARAARGQAEVLRRSDGL